MKLQKMRNLYYLELKFGKMNMSICHTMAAGAQKYIIAANTSREAKDMVGNYWKKGDPSKLEFNLNLKVRKIGLTNKKKGIMFCWAF